MKRATALQQEVSEIHTVRDLTEVFESIASMHIAKIRDRVIASKAFFAELWQTYEGLRIDPKTQMARNKHRNSTKDVRVIITAEGKLGGQISEQIVAEALSGYDASKADIITIGASGYNQLKHQKIAVASSFRLPTSDVNFSVTPVVEQLNHYRRISVFYQTYESLRTQKVARIELISAVRELGSQVEEGKVVSSRDYIFEPGIDKIADYMESVMMGVALIQIIMETKLAQHAGRYNSMNAAKRRANDMVKEYTTQFHQAKRSEADERLKEIMKVVQAHGISRTN